MPRRGKLGESPAELGTQDALYEASRRHGIIIDEIRSARRYVQELDKNAADAQLDHVGTMQARILELSDEALELLGEALDRQTDETEADLELRDKRKALTGTEKNEALTMVGDIQAKRLMTTLNTETNEKRQLIYSRIIATETNTRMQAEKAWKGKART